MLEIHIHNSFFFLKRKEMRNALYFKYLSYFFLSYAELAYTMVLTEKCDVYSFGVVALEILMGRHLGELLTSISSSSQNVMLNEILDQSLPRPNHLDAHYIFLIKINI